MTPEQSLMQPDWSAPVGTHDVAQTQTIEALRRQVETSNNAARDAQALLRGLKNSNNSTCACHRPATYQLQQRGTLATLPSSHLCQLHRQDSAQWSCMAQDTIM